MISSVILLYFNVWHKGTKQRRKREETCFVRPADGKSKRHDASGRLRIRLLGRGNKNGCELRSFEQSFSFRHSHEAER